MDLKSIIADYYPYWTLGAFMVWATARSAAREMVRVDRLAVFSWIRFLTTITCVRILMFALFPAMLKDLAKDITIIPWPLTLTVFWEDACHGLPLALIMRWLGTARWTWPIHGLLMLLVMVEFGLGHVYQGIPSAIALSFYIPYSIHLGKKYGFGTVMIGHTLYDLFTVVTIKLLLGA